MEALTRASASKITRRSRSPAGGSYLDRVAARSFRARVRAPRYLEFGPRVLALALPAAALPSIATHHRVPVLIPTTVRRAAQTRVGKGRSRGYATCGRRTLQRGAAGRHRVGPRGERASVDRHCLGRHFFRGFCSRVSDGRVLRSSRRPPSGRAIVARGWRAAERPIC